MIANQNGRAAPVDSHAATSFDEPGAGGGYGLSDRFEELKEAMRRANFHGHLETSQLRTAVVEQPKSRSKRGRKTRRKPGSPAQPAESKG